MNLNIRLIALACLAATSACDKPAADAAPDAPAGAASAASASAVARIVALPARTRCDADHPDGPAPTGTRVLDLGDGAFAVLADCTLEDASR
jgi:hypothetical protein